MSTCQAVWQERVTTRDSRSAATTAIGSQPDHAGLLGPKDLATLTGPFLLAFFGGYLFPIVWIRPAAGVAMTPLSHPYDAILSDQMTVVGQDRRANLSLVLAAMFLDLLCGDRPASRR